MKVKIINKQGIENTVNSNQLKSGWKEAAEKNGYGYWVIDEREICEVCGGKKPHTKQCEE